MGCLLLFIPMRCMRLSEGSDVCCEAPAVVHGVEVGDVYGVEQLQGAAEHLLPQAGVDGEHGVVYMRVVALDVAQDGEEQLLHLVVCGFYAVGVALVGFGREPPVVAVAGMEEGGAVAQGEDGAHPHVGGAVRVEVEVGRFDTLAEAQHRQGQTLVDAPPPHGVVGGEEVPVGMRGAPAGDVGVEMVLMEMGDNEIHRLPRSGLKQRGKAAAGVLPVVEDHQAVILFGGEAGMVDEMQLHESVAVRVWAQSRS